MNILEIIIQTKFEIFRFNDGYDVCMKGCQSLIIRNQLVKPRLNHQEAIESFCHDFIERDLHSSPRGDRYKNHARTLSALIQIQFGRPSLGDLFSALESDVCCLHNQSFVEKI